MKTGNLERGGKALRDAALDWRALWNLKNPKRRRAKPCRRTPKRFFSATGSAGAEAKDLNSKLPESSLTLLDLTLLGNRFSVNLRSKMTERVVVLVDFN